MGAEERAAMIARLREMDTPTAHEIADRMEKEEQ